MVEKAYPLLKAYRCQTTDKEAYWLQISTHYQQILSDDEEVSFFIGGPTNSNYEWPLYLKKLKLIMFRCIRLTLNY